MHRLKHIKLNSCSKEVLRQRLSSLKHTNFVGGASALALALLALVILSPTVSEGANAEETVIDAAVIGVDVNMDSVVSIALDNKAGIEITPKDTSTFKSQDAKLVITTNNLDGYKIFLAAGGGKAELTNMSVTTDQTIKSIVGTDILPTAFPDNTWGYNLAVGSTASGESTLYNAVPALSTAVKNVAKGETTGKDTYTLSFGAKANAHIPAGRYSNQVIVSAVANPIDINNLQHLTYMQDMTSEICANTRGTDGNTVSASAHNEPSKQLIDIRDGNTYWVSKLADGNCWMVQNLAYDITDERIRNGSINPTNTDVSAVWDAKSEYPPRVTIRQLKTEDSVDPVTLDNDATKSWDFGQYLLTSPTEMSSSEEGCDIAAGQSFATCKRLQPYTGEGDTHYLIGNYYQFNTAVAGSIGKKVDTVATQSICPKNWKLPAGYRAEGASSGSIAYLLQQYGFVSGPQNSELGINISSAPIYAIREGGVSVKGPELSYVGVSGGFWSDTAAYNSEYAYNLQLGHPMWPETVNPDGHNNLGRMNGRSVRCVAR